MRQLSKSSFVAAVVSFYFLTQTTPCIAQNSAKSPESVLTLTKTVTVIMKYGENHRLRMDVQGRFIYTIAEVRSDNSITGELADTVLGKLVYEIAQEERLRVAEATGVSDKIIPSSIGQDNAHAFFEEGAACPRIGLKFVPRGSYFGELHFHFDWFTLDLDEKPSELSKLFCEWRKMSNEGKDTDFRLLDRINRILKEEQKGDTK